MYLSRDEDQTGVMVPEKPAYFSRFALKFAEILGAGIATAVSGYLVAHLGGYLSWPTKASAPTAAIEAPSGGSAKTSDRPRNRATASAPVETHAAPDDRAKEPARTAAKPVEVSAPPTATAAAPMDNDDKRPRAAAAFRKPAADAHATKPAAHETAEAKAHEQEAVEDQIRAALANVDASRTPAPNTPTPAATTPAPQTAAIPQQPPIPGPSNPAAPASAPSEAASAAASTAPPVAVPPAGPVAPPLDIQNAAAASATTPTAPVAVSASAQLTPPDPGPLTTVEIKSRPVAGVGETSPGAQAAAEANSEPEGKAKGETDKGFFSTIAHLPEMLRANVHAPSGEPPRPPMPVGE
jgi:hypothetical protein